nr:C->U-editing enzyme APOBEC-1-like isoform X2 [Caretta caretta]
MYAEASQMGENENSIPTSSTRFTENVGAGKVQISFPSLQCDTRFNSPSSPLSFFSPITISKSPSILLGVPFPFICASFPSLSFLTFGDWQALSDKAAVNYSLESLSCFRGKILQETFIDSYDPSVLRRVQYMLYEIKWSTGKRLWQRCCHSTRTEHAEIHFIEDVFQEQRSDPSVHCSITWYMSWSPCGDCCKQIRDFLKEQPNVNLVIYVARIYWHKEENNRQGLRSLMNIGVSIQVMDLPVYSYCWRTFVNDEDKDEYDYWPRHFAPWIMLYSLELQSILQNIPSCLEISTDENQTPIFSLCVEDEEQKRALTSANP